MNIIIYIIKITLILFLILGFCGRITYLAARNHFLGCTLTVAVQHNDTATVLSLLRSGANPNFVSNVTPPLWRAILGHFGKWSLASSKDSVPLINALRWRENEFGEATAPPVNLEIIKALVKYGANVDSTDKDGMTALMFAAWTGDATSVKFLLSQGAIIDSSDNSGWTSLMFACLCNHEDIAQILHSNHCDVDKKNNIGETAFVLSMRTGNPKIIKLLKNQ